MLLIAVATAAQRHRAVHFPNPQPVPQPQPVPVTPQHIDLTSSKDNTLFENGTGSLSDGAGVHLFAGKTNTGSRRRAVMAFDLSQIPAGATITGVTLTLHISQTVSGTETMTLHAVAADWGEGASNAGVFRDGDGTPAKTNDATWLHRFFSATRWSNAGGDFDSSVDASAAAGAAGEDIVFNATTAMIARVQGWLDHPSTNFGWMVIGNENATRTTKEIESRESPSASTRPTLAIDYLP